MKANYHSHTPRCKHATGTVEEYVNAAIEGGFDVLGISDHTPNHYSTGYVATMRMGEEELGDYVESVRTAGEKYKDRIRVLCGLECEYFPDHFGWILEQKEKYALDYLILGNHFDTTDDTLTPGGGFYFGGLTEPDKLRRYTEMTIKGMETGKYLYVAHPDVALSQYPSFDSHAKDMANELCRAAKALGIPLEYNLLGRMHRGSGRFQGLGYPCEQFWETAAKWDVDCVIGVDAHSPEHLLKTEAFDSAVEYLRSLGLKRREMLL